MTGPAHPPKRRRWPYVLAALIGLLCVLVVLVMRDDPRDDYSDLAPTERAAKPNGVAAFDEWLVAFAKIDHPPIDDAYRDDPKFYDRLYGSEPWKADGVERILSANRDALAAARVADTLGPFTLPPVADMASGMPHLGDFQKMAKLLRIEAAERQAAGAHTEACDASLLGLRSADNLIAESNTIIDFLIGTTAQAITLTGAERLLADDTPDAELARLDTALAREGDVHAMLAEAYRREFAMIVNTIDDYENLQSSFFPKKNQLPLFLLKKNRTLNASAKQHRRMISNTERPPAERVQLEIRTPRLLSSNAVGERFLAMNYGGAITEKADLALAQRRLLRLKIALFRHHRDQAAFPASPTALVPKYIEAVPADPFDGKPIRYDPIRGAVWVIGKDLTDGGGSASPGKRGFGFKDPDPTLFVFPHRAAP